MPSASRTLLVGLLLVSACASGPCAPEAPQDPPADGSPAVHGYEIVATYPHDRSAYTQGLLYHGGALYESTGRERQSTLRRVDPTTGKVVLRHDLEPTLFGEGLALWKDLLFQATWKNEVIVVYDARSFQELDRRVYEREMWGLASDGEHLILSDGSATLRYLDPRTMDEVRTLDVTYVDPGTGRVVPLIDLNELEVIEGEIWANVYQTELIARIDPESGRVRSLVDFGGLLAQQGVYDSYQDVLNGIAWDAEGERIFITGKYWPNLYVIRVGERKR